MSEFLEFVGVSKRFGSVKAVNNVSFSVKRGEFFSLLGPSGCGKTTLLRLIAGFEQPDEGRILLDGMDITQLPSHHRPVNTVFQNYALFPHMTVFDNIAFGLRVAHRPKDEIEEEVMKMLKLVQMEDKAYHFPNQISGGQKQRVAIVRALVNKPRVLLLDEPLAALDLKLRQRMLLELDLIHDQVGITFLYVTHDQEEALTMSDTIVVMKDGTIQQIGDPKTIYDEPANAFVADFIGESNILRGTMIKDELVEFAGATFPCVDSGFGENAPVDVVIRPEDIMLVGEDVGQIVGTVKSVLFKGVHYEMMIDTGAYTFKVHSTTMQPQGSKVGVNIVPFNIHIMKPMQEEN